jgi:hypothetical protein
LTSRSTPNPVADNFSGIQIIVQLTEFTVQPSRCEVSYSCTSVSRKDGVPITSTLGCSDITLDGDIDGIGNDGQLIITASEDDYTSGKIVPGTYVVEITGTSGSTDPKTEKTTIEVTFTDPCDPPVSINAPVFENQVYTLTDPNASPYTTQPEFIVEPGYCQYSITWTISNLSQVQ